MALPQQKDLESQYVMPTFARKSVELVEGEGMYVLDSEGRRYLDFIAGIGVDSLGHCHPTVSNAIAAQAKKLIHVGNYYYVENRGEVARLLSGLLNENFDEAKRENWQSFFANSGAEANECAIKLARLVAKKRGRSAQTIVTLEGSFHGRTLATLSATAQPAKQAAFQPLPGGFVHVAINDAAALEHLFAEQGDSICAIMIECIQGESGVHLCEPSFMEACEHLAHKHDALFICDEIQTGIYRTGTYPFAFQHYGACPDIVTIAKGVASGFPTGMCSARESVAAAFESGDHGSTFGGSCLAVAAAKATLETLIEGDFAAHVEKIGQYLRTGLATLPQVTEVRGKGLMCACDLKEDIAPAFVESALEKGFLINATGPRTLRFLPPLICQEQEIDALISALAQ